MGDETIEELREAWQASRENNRRLADTIRGVQAQNAELKEEIATLRAYSEETGKVLLDEIDETSLNTLSVVEASTVLTRHMIDRAEDSFTVSVLVAFVADGDAEAEPQRYDLIIQKAGAQTFQENLDACKAENATLRATAELVERTSKVGKMFRMARLNIGPEVTLWTYKGGTIKYSDLREALEALGEKT